MGNNATLPPATSDRPVALLLAAGAGTRFGGGKVAYPLPSFANHAMGRVCADRLSAAGFPVFVVIRAGDINTASLFRGSDVLLIDSKHAHLGMGHSIADAVAMTPMAQGWLIALADMPFVQPTTLTHLSSFCATKTGTPAICRPRHCGQPGHPVYFSRHFHDELLALHGDEGAKGLLQRHSSLVLWLDVDDVGVTQDVDYRPFP